MVLSFSFLYSEITSRPVFRFPILSPSSLAISGILTTAISLPHLLSSLSFPLSFSLYLPKNLSFSLSFYCSLSHSFLFFSRSFYLPTFPPSLFSFYLLNLDFVSLFQINFLSLYLPQSFFFPSRFRSRPIFLFLSLSSIPSLLLPKFNVLPLDFKLNLF